LFQIRNATLIHALPLREPEAFDNNPLLLGSRPTANSQLREAGAIVTGDGAWQPGDTFLLVSDALAASFLRQWRDAECSLPFERTAVGFRSWVRSMRAERLMRNDDVSLVWLAMSANAAA
jgi:hypothetical protein